MPVDVKYTTEATANEIVDAWLKTPFAGGRHGRRVDKMNAQPHPLDILEASDSAVSSTPVGAIATIARTRSSFSEGRGEGAATGEGGVASPERARLQKIGSSDASA